MRTDGAARFMPEFLRRIAHDLGVDRAIVYGVMARIWTMGSGVVTLLLIAAYFSREMQGYYYTFMNLVALQVFGELGLGQVLIQFASHEWAHLGLDVRGRVAGDKHSFRRLAGLIHFAIRWFAAASLLFFVGVEAAGYFTFHNASPHLSWPLPWVCLCLAVVLDLCLLPLWSILEGTNQIASIYFLRFVRAMVSGVALWLAIVAGAGLWSAAISMWSGILVMAFLSLPRHGAFFLSLLRHPDYEWRGWWKELWPMQWRIAVSFVSGYFAFSLFTPVLFKFQGAVVAGQMGMSWSVIQVLGAVSGIFIQTKAPRFGMLIAHRNWKELDRLALKSGGISVLVLLVGAVALLGLMTGLDLAHLALAERFLPLGTFCLFLLGTIINQITLPMSFYLRAHKQEPYLWLSLGVGLIVGLNTVFLGRYGGAFAMAVGYAATYVLFALPLAIIILLRKRAEWHTSAAEPVG